MRGAQPGERRGGRRKGALNKVTAEQQRKVLESGLAPLDYLLTVMRDEAHDQTVRMEAAKAAAPYVHPRLAAVQHSGVVGRPTHEDWLAVIADRVGLAQKYSLDADATPSILPSLPQISINCG